MKRRLLLHSCSDNSSTTFLKILGPGHQRSGHQVRSSDPTSGKFTIASRPQWLREKFEAFRIWYTTKYVPTTCISRIFFYIGDLRSGQFRDLPIIGRVNGEKLKCLKSVKTDQICSNRSEPCSIRLLLMTWVQLCICDSRKGRLWSNNDVMRSMYVFAYKFR